MRWPSAPSARPSSRAGIGSLRSFGWTRIDIPFLHGTIFTENRRAAAVIGYFAHVFNSLVFALLYAAVFAAAGLTTWWFGLALGAVQAGFAGGALVNLLLPAVHPVLDLMYGAVVGAFAAGL